MPSYEDPRLDAAELSEAARALAYATRQVENPADSYAVLGDLQSALISLHQSVRQLALMHTNLADRAATDDGDRAVGREHAQAAAMRLEYAAAHLDRATDHVMAGFAESGQIAWQPAPSPVEHMLAERAHDLEATAHTPSKGQTWPEAAPGR